MLRDDRDLVRIIPVDRPLRKYDLPLYRRSEGVYVLHRIIRVTPDGYDIRGDNTYCTEKGIKDSQIIGVLDSFTRNGKTRATADLAYRCYVRIHCAAYPLRWTAVKSKDALRGIIRKIHHRNED